MLLVDGHFKSEPFQAETDYLAAASSPESTSDGHAVGDPTEVVPEGQLARRDLRRYDAVMLCNIAQFTEAEVAGLEDYLKQGGGVVVFGGDQVVADNYNRLMLFDAEGGKGRGILPALDRRRRSATPRKRGRPSGSTPWAIGTRSSSRSPTSPTPSLAGLTGVKTWQFHKLKLADRVDGARWPWRSTTATRPWSRCRGSGGR